MKITILFFKEKEIMQIYHFNFRSPIMLIRISQMTPPLALPLPLFLFVVVL